MMQRLLKTPNAGQLFNFLRRLKKLLTGLGVRETVLLPAIAGGQELLFLIHRKAGDPLDSLWGWYSVRKQ